jgi:hypothetical protein
VRGRRLQRARRRDPLTAPLQNPTTQQKQVCVVFRKTAVMRDTLEEALRDAIEARR